MKIILQEGYFMKTCKRIFAVLLLLSCVFVLASCGTFSGIKKNFTDAGWTLVELSEDEEEAKTATAVVAHLEEADITCTLHIFKKDLLDLGALTQYQFAYILEFNSDSDLDNALEEIIEGIDSAAVRGLVEGLVEDAQNSDYINGNCFLLPSLINNSEKVELFIKNKP